LWELRKQTWQKAPTHQCMKTKSMVTKEIGNLLWNCLKLFTPRKFYTGSSFGFHSLATSRAKIIPISWQKWCSHHRGEWDRWCGPPYKYGSKMVRVLKHGPATEKTIQRKRGFRDGAIWLYSGLAWGPSIVLPSRPAVLCLKSNGSISETVRNRTHVHIKCFA
jgi:hypothetical protein